VVIDRNGFLSALLFVSIGFGSAVPASASGDLRDFLKAFHEDPYEMMQRRPDSVDSSGHTHPRGYLQWDSKEFASEYARHAQVLDEIRLQSSFLNRVLDTNDPAIIVDEPESMIRNLGSMQTQNYVKGQMTPMPWADSYWPFYLGNIAFRYADRSTSRQKNFTANYESFQSRPTSEIVASGDAAAIDLLSPAEKYDLLVGDPNFTMTHFAWQRGLDASAGGKGVATWTGICHGWAAAASMNVQVAPAPIQTKTPGGLPITFYPEDVRALQSMLWANAPPSTRFAGDRCSIANPPRDTSGRIIDKACRGVNPSTWHLAAVNQLGAKQRSFILNNGHDAEIWNYPIASFHYHYFNPQTWEEGANLSSTMIPLKEFTLDKFAAHRAKEAVYVVGIVFDVTYVIETMPTRAESATNPTQTLELIYDLELDAAGNVVGEGEWYSNAHPDFIWGFARGAQAVAAQDASLTETWSPAADPIPQTWSDVAPLASRRGVPLYSILKSFAPAALPAQ
jgi:hypothetical protein